MRCALAALAVLALPAPAAADEIDSARSIHIAVAGTIAQRCSIGNVDSMDFGDLNRRGLSAKARVAFECNVPFTMSIKGATGALTNTVMPLGQGPYSGSVPYSLALSMPVRHPAVEVLGRSFDGRQLRGGGSFSSNGGIATDGMMLTVDLGSPPGEAGLLAGKYAETITITVTPS